MTGINAIVLLLFATIFMPPLSLGVLRKMKARLQNRIGAPIMQPIFDLARLFSKSETVSQDTSWIFRITAVANFTIMILLAVFVPWLSFKAPLVGCSDLFLIVYLFGLSRFFTVLAALDAGSAFGGFGASREVTLALLVEPAVILCLASLGACGQTSDLSEVLSTGNTHLANHGALWIMAGSGLFLSSLVELSRMPADDPTTHLELTMVHEAMILENSAANLALVEYAHMIKLAVLLGLSGQCLLHALPAYWSLAPELQVVSCIASVFVLTMVVALIESTAVKLRWTKLPEFIAYPVALSLLCILVAIGK